MKRLRLLLLVFLPLVAVGVAVLSVLNLPAADDYLKRALPRWANTAGYALSANTVDLEPWGLRLTVTGMEVRPLGAETEWEVSAERVAVRLLPLQSLLGVPHLEVALDSPRLRGALAADAFGGGSTGPGRAAAVFHTLKVVDGSADLVVPERDLEVSVSGITVGWVEDAGRGSAGGVRVRWRGGETSLERVEFAGARKFAALSLDRLHLEGPGVALQAEGRVGPWRLLGLDVEGQLDLNSIPAPWLEVLRVQRYAPLAGRAVVRGRVEGSSVRPEFRGSVELQDGRFGVLRDARLDARLEATADGLRFRQLGAASNLVSLENLNGELRWGDGIWLRAEGRATDYRLRPFMGLFLDGYFPVDLTAAATFHAEGPLYPELALAVQGEANVRDLVVATADEGEEPKPRFTLPAAKLRTRLTVGSEEITFGPSRVGSDTVDVEVASGRIRYQEGLWFSTVGQIRSLELARPYLPEWIGARGRVEGRFGGPYRELEFHYDVDLDSVALFGTEVGRLRGHGDYDLREVRVSGGRLAGPLGRFFADGSVIALPGGEHRWDLRLEQGDLAAAVGLLRRAGVPLPVELAGEIRSEGELSGPLADPQYTGNALVSELTVDRFHLGEVEVKGQASRQGWRVTSAEFVGYGARGEGTGHGDRVGFEAETRLSGLRVEEFLGALGTPLDLDGGFSGSAQVGGEYPAPRVVVRGKVDGPRARGIQLPDSDLRLAVDREAVEADVTALDGRLKGWVRLGFAQGAIDARLEADRVPWSVLPQDRLPPGLSAREVTATVELKVPGGGAETMRSLVVRGQGVLGGVAWHELSLGPIDLSGEYAAGVAKFRAAAWDRSVRVAGSYSPGPGSPVELTAELMKFALRNLQPYVPVTSGLASGSGRVSLRRELLGAAEGAQRLSALAELEVNATVSGVRDARGLELPELVVNVAGPAGKPVWRVEGRGVSLRGEVEDPEHASWRTEVKFDRFVPWPLLASVYPGSEWAGQLTGAGQVRGVGGQVSSGSAKGRLEGLAWGGWGRSAWDWEVDYSRPHFHAALREPRGLSAAVDWRPDSGLELELALADVPLAGWVAGEGPAAEIGGAVTGRGSMHWSPGQLPRARLDLSSLRLEQQSLVLSNAEPVQIRWADGVVHLDRVALSGNGAKLSLSGSAQPQQSWDLTAEGRLDLAAVAAWLPQLEKGEGLAEIGLEISGPWADPVVRGPVEILPGATLKPAGFPIALEDLDAYGALDGAGQFTLDWLDAQVRDGRLHVEGRLGLTHWRPEDLRFYAEVRDLDYQWPSQVEYRFDADALITGSVAAPQVRGEIRLQQFRYQRRIDWKRLVLDALNRKPRNVETRAQDGVFVDLAVRGSDDIRVENNLAELDLAADLRVRGHLPNPTIWGRVDVVDGTVTLRSREYQALRSTVEFLGEAQPVPQLDLHAQTLTRNYTVNVDVTGPLDRYQVSLSSVPYLSHTDIVALLTLGLTAEEMQGSDNLAGIEAASILSEGLQDEFTAVGQVFGVDTFHIDPSYSSSTQTTVPRVTIGKGITEELYARYSAAVGVDTRQNVELEYTLSPRLSLLGSWVDRESHQQGSLGGEVRFRFRFR